MYTTNGKTEVGNEIFGWNGFSWIGFGLATHPADGTCQTKKQNKTRSRKIEKNIQTKKHYEQKTNSDNSKTQ